VAKSIAAGVGIYGDGKSDPLSRIVMAWLPKCTRLGGVEFFERAQEHIQTLTGKRGSGHRISAVTPEQPQPSQRTRKAGPPARIFTCLLNLAWQLSGK